MRTAAGLAVNRHAEIPNRHHTDFTRAARRLYRQGPHQCGIPIQFFLVNPGGCNIMIARDNLIKPGRQPVFIKIGHIDIDPEGIECPCGSFGCLETMASAPNIVRRSRLRLQRDATSTLRSLAARGGFSYEDLVAAANAGDDLAKMMLDRTGHFIGRAVAGVINLLNLSMVAIGGMPAARRFLVPAIADETRRRAFDAAFEDCRIVAAELDGEAGVIGAALLAKKALADSK